MKRHRFLVVVFCALPLVPPTVDADDSLARLTKRFCVNCHSGDQPAADLHLGQLTRESLEDQGRIESMIGVLTRHEMPPEESQQPSDELRSSSIALLKAKLQQHDPSGRLKRLTRDEYTNTLNDLFGTAFNLTDLLPPDPPGDGFNKWGAVQRMSPHQVQSYLRTARFVSDRLILDDRPVQHTWEFDLKNFRGTGRGDFQTKTEHVLTTHYPWRSILYFVDASDPGQIFRIPEYGRYWIQADVKAHYSEKPETVSLSLGDPRFPTNIRKSVRAVLSPESDSIFLETTIRAGTHLSFTYDSASTWNTGNKGIKYKGRQVRFTKVRVTGPITSAWPTVAQDRIFGQGRYDTLKVDNIRDFTEHVIELLLNRSIPETDVLALQQLTADRYNATGSRTAAARTLMTALLSSPHFIYKHEGETLSDIALAHRLSYFLWNSVPDEKLLGLARSGKIKSRNVLEAEVQRMLVDARSDRFCRDFTRQWLATDKIDDIGPDDRVHDTKKVTFVRVRELANEPSAFFRELMRHGLSMENFIDSDFAMVNDETAEYYGFEPVQGREFQRVKIPSGNQRGGLIGQAGLLKLTSSKHATSPILRGSWILKNIYCEKLNPPPGVAAQEPDIRGAKTVKEVIEIHKTNQSCNRCHSRIDPFGLALEHFDEMGLFREQYNIIETRVGNKEIKRRSAPIDSEAELPDGRTVSSMTQLKAIMMEDRETILKGILAKLASYALGREFGVRDEAMIDEIYDRIGNDDYSLTAAIHAIVAHEAFGKP